MVDLTNSEVKISNLNYSKNTKQKAELKFDFNFILENYYNIKRLEFSESKNKIYFSNLKINKNFQTENFEKIEIKTFSNGLKNNDFSAIKTKKIVVSGEVFDAQPLLKSLYTPIFISSCFEYSALVFSKIIRAPPTFKHL